MKRSSLAVVLCVLLIACVALAEVVKEASILIASVETSSQVRIEVEEVSSQKSIIGDDVVLQEVKLTNTGIAAWVRVKRTLERGANKVNSISFAELPPLAYLEKADGYLYFVEPLLANTTISWKEYIEVSEAERDYSNTNLYSELVAEGVQEAFFTPDFASDTPWAHVQPTFARRIKEEDDASPY